MSRTTSANLDLARALVVCESNATVEPSDFAGPAPFRVCEKLRGNLAGLLGGYGFRAMLSRALVLASAEVSWLRTLATGANGTLEGLEKIRAQMPSKQIVEGGVILVARLVGLLVDLIGVGLTRQLLREVWPSLPGEYLKTEKALKNENKK